MNYVSHQVAEKAEKKLKETPVITGAYLLELMNASQSKMKGKSATVPAYMDGWKECMIHLLLTLTESLPEPRECYYCEGMKVLCFECGALGGKCECPCEIVDCELCAGTGVEPKVDLQIGATQRGFDLIKFTDQYGTECTLHKSSVATEACIWLGTDKDRMHLTLPHVKALLPHLIKFVQEGELT